MMRCFVELFVRETRLGMELGGGAVLRSAVRTDMANMAFLAMIQAYNAFDLQPLPSGSLGGWWMVGSAVDDGKCGDKENENKRRR
ncbi:flagellar biosynthesis protein FliA [Sesbania bispinosa]|nr:flagellar biosynthesis protein FliA [Sesbania bispinosa]